MKPAARARWRARVQAASRRQLKPWVSALRTEFALVADEVERGSFDALAHQARLQDLLEKHYRLTGEAFMTLGRAMLDQGQRAIPARFGDRVAGLIRFYGPSRARAISRRTASLITETLAEAAREGLGPVAAARRVRQAVSASKMAVRRAQTIARTEIGAAQNAGMIDAAEETGAAYTKEWVSIHDARTRLSHSLADGTKIAHGESFKVGSSTLEYPGDPKGLPEEIINCRCTMLLERAAS